MRRILLVIAAVLALVAPTLSSVGGASAGTSKAAYSWHVADDFLEENVGSLAIELTSAEQARLDDAFRPGSAEGARYPASMRTLDSDDKHDLTVLVEDS